MAKIEDKPETITVKIEVTYELTGGLDLLGAMGDAREILDRARERAAAHGEVIMGRRRFEIG